MVTELEAQVKQIKGEPFSASDKAYDSSLSADERQHAKQANKSGQFTELSKPQLLLSSPSGIGITAKESMHLSSNEHVVLTSEQDTSVVAGSRLSVSTNSGIRVFSQAEGIKLFAGKDDVELQVQDGKLIETARDDVEVTSTEGSINLTSPKEICLRAGGSEIKINSAGVFITTPGIFKVHAATHDLVEPESIPVSVPNLPASYQAQFRFADDDDVPYVDTPYIAINKNTQETFEGVTDKEGLTKIFFSKNPDEIQAHLRDGKYKAQFRFADDDDFAYSFVDYIAQAVLTGEVFEGTTDVDGYTEVMLTSIEQEFKVHLLGVNNKESEL